MAGTVVRAVARDHRAARPARRLARDLHRVLVGIGAAEGEVHPPAREPRPLQQRLRQLRARLRSPRIGDEAQTFGLRADRLDQARMLVPQVAALGEAAEVEDLAAVGQMQARTASTDDRRRVPVGLDRPAVQHAVALGDRHPLSTLPGPQIVRCAHVCAYCAPLYGSSNLAVNRPPLPAGPVDRLESTVHRREQGSYPEWHGKQTTRTSSSTAATTCSRWPVGCPCSGRSTATTPASAWPTSPAAPACPAPPRAGWY